MTIIAKNWTKKFVCLLLAAMIFAQLLIPIHQAQAGLLNMDVWYIQTSVDDKSWSISGGVATNSINRVSVAGSDPNSTALEGQRLTEDMISSINGGDALDVLKDFDIDTDYTADNCVKDDLPLTYPDSVGSLSSSATSEDRDRAQLVLDSLLYDLNSAFMSCYDLTKVTSVSDYQTKLIALIEAAQGGGSPSGADYSGMSFRAATSSDVDEFPDENMSASNYVVLTNSSSGDNQTLCFSIKKYAGGSGITIDWAVLAAEAFINYGCGVEASAVYSGEVGFLEEQLVGMFNGIIDWASGALGLWTLDELVFNDGLRGGVSYAYGVFPTAWQSTVWTFFFIGEIIAIALLLFAIINNVVKKAMSTVNPITRANAMNQLMDILKIVVLLMLLPILLQIGLSLSAKLASVFGAALGGETASEKFDAIIFNSATIGGVIISLLYLGAIIYFNAYYFMRSVIIAFLVIVAPIAISMIGISEEFKKYYQKWQNTIISYVAIQPIHALILTILVVMPTSGRPIENVVAVYALIPLGKMAKKMLLPDGEDDSAARFGDMAKEKANNTMAGAAEGALAATATARLASKQERDRYNDAQRANDSSSTDGFTAKDKYNPDTQEDKTPVPQDKTSEKQGQVQAPVQSQQEQREALKAAAAAGGGDVNDTGTSGGTASEVESVGSTVSDKDGDGTPDHKENSFSGNDKKVDTKDSDGDGTPDSKESAFSGNDKKAASADVDGDGTPDSQENSFSGNNGSASKDDSSDVANDLAGDTSVPPITGGSDVDTPVDTSSIGDNAAVDDSTTIANETADDSKDPNNYAWNVAQKGGQRIGEAVDNTAHTVSRDAKRAYGATKQFFSGERSAASKLRHDKRQAIVHASIPDVKARRDAIKDRHLGVATAMMGGALMGMSGGRLGRGMYQAGMYKASYGGSRQSRIENQMYEKYNERQNAALEAQRAANPEFGNQNVEMEMPIKQRRGATPMTDYGEAHETSSGWDISMDKDAAAEFGMDNIRADNDSGKFSYVTNDNTSAEDMETLSQMADVFKNGSAEDVAMLRANGYDHVSAHTVNGQPTGQFYVSHNRNYAGAHNGRTMSCGDSGRGSVNVSNYSQSTPLVKSVDDCRDYNKWKGQRDQQIANIKSNHDSGLIDDKEYKAQMREVRSEKYNWNPGYGTRLSTHSANTHTGSPKMNYNPSIEAQKQANRDGFNARMGQSGTRSSHGNRGGGSSPAPQPQQSGRNITPPTRQPQTPPTSGYSGGSSYGSGPSSRTQPPTQSSAWNDDYMTEPPQGAVDELERMRQGHMPMGMDDIGL